MSWDPKTGFSLGTGFVVPGEAQEQAHPTSPPVALTSNAPNRSQMIAATAVTHPNSQTQQGVVATSQSVIVYAGAPPQPFARWW